MSNKVISHPEFLDCPKYEIIPRCPICSAHPKSERPEAGTHAFTIPYECGTEIDYPIGHEGAVYGATCDGQIKRYVMPKITPEVVEEYRKRLGYKEFPNNDKLTNGHFSDCEEDHW